MKKSLLAMMALTAVLAACKKTEVKTYEFHMPDIKPVVLTPFDFPTTSELVKCEEKDKPASLDISKSAANNKISVNKHIDNVNIEIPDCNGGVKSLRGPESYYSEVIEVLPPQGLSKPVAKVKISNAMACSSTEVSVKPKSELQVPVSTPDGTLVFMNSLQTVAVEDGTVQVSISEDPVLRMFTNSTTLSQGLNQVIISYYAACEGDCKEAELLATKDVAIEMNIERGESDRTITRETTCPQVVKE